MRIVIIQGHPDMRDDHFCHGLADAYRQGAEAAGAEVRTLAIAPLEFPVIRSDAQWRETPPPQDILHSQEQIRWADHLLIVFPLWLGTMPALLKAFFEQVMRPGFALDESDPDAMPMKLLRGKSAHLVVTMGMPAPLYRWYFQAHSIKSLERNVLGMCGIGPIRRTLIGSVDGDAGQRARWLDTVRALGQAHGAKSVKR